MTETIFFEKFGNLKKALREIKEKLNVKIRTEGRKVTIEGEAVDEYEAKMIFDAVNLGFSARTALLLRNEGHVLRILNIKQFTRRKNIKEVVARIIGTEGKTKRAIEGIANCSILIHDHEVGIIGAAEDIEKTTIAITNLIKGSKQANVYAFLEKMNKEKRN